MMMALVALPTGAAYATTSTAPAAVQNVQHDAECKGVVKDASGEAIIGVSVVVKGTTNGTVTGLDGDFKLSNVKKGATLRFTSLIWATTLWKLSIRDSLST